MAAMSSSPQRWQEPLLIVALETIRLERILEQGKVVQVARVMISVRLNKTSIHSATTAQSMQEATFFKKDVLFENWFVVTHSMHDQGMTWLHQQKSTVDHPSQCVRVDCHAT